MTTTTTTSSSCCSSSNDDDDRCRRRSNYYYYYCSRRSVIFKKGRCYSFTKKNVHKKNMMMMMQRILWVVAVLVVVVCPMFLCVGGNAAAAAAAVSAAVSEAATTTTTTDYDSSETDDTITTLPPLNNTTTLPSESSSSIIILPEQQQEQQNYSAEATAVNEEEESQVHNDEDDDVEQPLLLLVVQEECGIWLGPSTIPGAGLGMFAGKDYDATAEIGYTGDSVVSIVDFQPHNNAAHDDIHVEGYNTPFLWNEYLWGGTTTLGNMDGWYGVNLASTGFGSAANSYLPLINVIEWFPIKDASVTTTNGLHRSISTNPSIGSFSPYYNRLSTAKTPISAGQELFVSYTDSWFENRPHFGLVPLENDFNEAQVLIQMYKSLRNNVNNDTLSMDVWDAFVKSTAYIKQSRVINAFHHHDNMKEMNILTETNTTLSELRKQQMAHSIPWLQQYGTCGDNLVAKTSSLPGAGRGAYATRNLPKGIIVAQLPMIHIPDKSVLEMYNFATTITTEGGNEEEEVGTYIPNKASGKMGYQLLLNYCFGHRQSTLLLCPYGPMTNYINHNQTLANVKVRWGRKESGNHDPEILRKPVLVLTIYNSAKLAMELVATRDILEGEEIVLDYGDEWEQAWQEHVENWKPMDGAHMYKSAADYNVDKATKLPSIFEQITDPTTLFPPNVKLTCFSCFHSTYENEWQSHAEQGILNHFLEHHLQDYEPCVILRSQLTEDGTYSYTVHMYKIDSSSNAVEEGASNDGEGNFPEENMVVENLPRAALRFYDMPYTDDTFIPNAFRHDIRIPDEIFPEIWKNIPQEDEIPENMEEHTQG